jgi:hypothetical protein
MAYKDHMEIGWSVYEEKTFLLFGKFYFNLSNLENNFKFKLETQTLNSCISHIYIYIYIYI